MSTQKAKFQLFQRLQDLGFTYDEAVSLRRIEMTLQRWAELECGDGNEHGSWAVERDEKTEKPFMVQHHYRHGNGRDTLSRYAIADREAGALKRLARIIKARNKRNSNLTRQWEVISYHQGDCRGCMLYLLTVGQLGADNIESVYTRGLAVCC